MGMGWLTLPRRFALLVALMFWQGGFTFYGAVVVPGRLFVDLARLLGSMVEDDAEKRHVGLIAYTGLRSLSWEEQSLVHILDETGTIIAVANWLKWLYRDGKTFADRTAVAQRIAKLVERMEKRK